MARSKAPLFEVDEQMASKLCQGMAHPARVRIISRLINGDSLPYTTLIAGIPLDERTCMQHISLLTRLDFLRPALLYTKQGGYRLNLELFSACSMASRRLLRVDGRIRRIVDEREGKEIG